MGGVHDVAYLDRLKQGVDGVGDARRLGAPEREMCLRKVRKDVGDDIAGADPEVMEQIGRLGDPASELPVGYLHRAVPHLAGHEEVERNRIGIHPSAASDLFVGALGGDPFLKRHGLDGANVLDAAYEKPFHD